MADAICCFTDTESTGLEPDDEVWEFACRRRNVDGTTDELHLFIEHDQAKAQRLPLQFFRDYLDRFPVDETWDKFEAAAQIQMFTLGAHIIGVNPSFDTEKLEIFLRSQGLIPKWNYHKGDVSNIAVGYLAGRGTPVLPPWKSDELSRAIGVDPNDFARHTALGDVLWAEAQWDAMMGSSAGSGGWQ